MSNSAKSVFYFGVYLIVLGIALMLFPNPLLNLFGVPSTSEVWIRVVAMLLLALSVYYIVASRLELTPIFKVTMYIRSTIILFFIAFSVAGFVTPNIILFAVIDFLGAVWTYLALRKEGKLS
ncbi:MAG: hypothetical protein V4615_04845 [Bacteroidota bacterium]